MQYTSQPVLGSLAQCVGQHTVLAACLSLTRLHQCCMAATFVTSHIPCWSLAFPYLITPCPCCACFSSSRYPGHPHHLRPAAAAVVVVNQM